jgi:prepilin peptidase CpaA
MTDLAWIRIETQSLAASAPWAVALVASSVAAFSDARTRRIPNLLTFPMLLLGFLVSVLPGSTVHFQDALLGCLLLGVPYFFLFVFAGGGAGDSKMMAAIGAWVGLAGAVPVLVAVSLSGGMLAIAYAILRGRMSDLAGNLRAILWGAALVGFCRVKAGDAQQVFPESQRMLRMPYGMAIFVGTLLAAGWVFLWY